MQYTDEQLQQVIEAVQSGSGYRAISRDLVERMARTEMRKRSSLKEVIKATRSALHQAVGAYRECFDPVKLQKELAVLGSETDEGMVKAFCLKAMRSHASTQERLPFLELFYQQVLEDIAPLRSVLDLACGLNPLALPWMPLTKDAPYHCYDVEEDLVRLDREFLLRQGRAGESGVCDLTTRIPVHRVHLAMLLKTIPVLDQQDKQASQRVIDSLQAEHLLITFPAKSLGGRAKGMPATYEARMMQLVEGRPWTWRKFSFATELVFIITK